MATLTIELLNPKAKKLLDDLAELRQQQKAAVWYLNKPLWILQRL
jgi:hypothetical protein